MNLISTLFCLYGIWTLCRLYWFGWKKSLPQAPQAMAALVGCPMLLILSLLDIYNRGFIGIFILVVVGNLGMIWDFSRYVYRPRQTKDVLSTYRDLYGTEKTEVDYNW